jgi:glycosyltransferase involved in cell wall biosynthesis
MRERLDSHGDRYWLGVFGAITPRKNLPLIVEAILDQPEVGLLIAGIVHPEVSHAVAPLLSRFVTNGGQVISLEGPLTDAEFDSAIGAVDCVVAAHSNEASSGVVLRAAASGRRLVLAGAGYLRRDAGSLGDQATWSPLELDELRRAIRQARALPAPRVRVELNADEFVRALTWA